VRVDGILIVSEYELTRENLRDLKLENINIEDTALGTILHIDNFENQQSSIVKMMKNHHVNYIRLLKD